MVRFLLSKYKNLPLLLFIKFEAYKSDEGCIENNYRTVQDIDSGSVI